jgi:cobalt-zinc-cadmium resistance protein CzcA
MRRILRIRRVALLLGLLAGLFTPAYSQNTTSIALEDALHQGRLHWLLLRSDTLRHQARSLELRGGPLPDPATIQSEWGQLNSSLRDQSLQINQSLRLPVYHRRSRDLARTRLEGARLEQTRTLAELESGMIRLYHRYLVEWARCQLYQEYDSILAATAKTIEKRYQQGQVSAANRNQLLLIQGESSQILAQHRSALEQTARDFRFWTGGTGLPNPAQSDLRWKPAKPGLLDTLTHPEVLRLHNQWQEASAMSRLTQAQRLPGLSLGLRNMSIQGMGPDGQFFPLSRRFNTLQAGISLPLRGKPWRLQTEADRHLAEAAALQYHHGRAVAANERTRDQERMRLLLEQWNYSTQSLLPLAQTLRNQAESQLAQGELDLLPWINHLERILWTRSSHLDLTEQLNEAIIQWHYPNANNQPQ